MRAEVSSGFSWAAGMRVHGLDRTRGLREHPAMHCAVEWNVLFVGARGLNIEEG